MEVTNPTAMPTKMPIEPTTAPSIKVRKRKNRKPRSKGEKNKVPKEEKEEGSMSVLFR